MKMKLLMMLVAMALLAGTAQAEMLTNAGFEAGTYGAKNIPDDWSLWYGGYTIAHNWNATGGHGDNGKNMYLYGYSWWNGTSSAFYTEFLYQYVEVTGGAEYSFSVWAKDPAGGTVTTYGYLTWLDAASSYIDGYWLYPDIDAGATWTEISFGTETAPATAVGVLYSLAGYYPTLYDDASMTPEPVTLSLLGLGGIMLVRRRKRA